MQVESNVLFAAQDTVARVPLEVVPDLFRRIEFRGVGGEAFEVKPGIGILNCPDVRSLMNRAPIPNEDDMPAQMFEQQSEKLRHLRGLEIILSTLHV